MNLEKMTIGYKPNGFPMERRNRNYWNALDLSITVRLFAFMYRNVILQIFFLLQNAWMFHESILNFIIFQSQHVTATVTHWTGRTVCSASTKEWAIRKFLYNYTDNAALKCVAKIIGKNLGAYAVRKLPRFFLCNYKKML